MDHRAISLMANFIDIINNRIVYYMDTQQLFADEQTGFGRMQAFQHMCVTSIIHGPLTHLITCYCGTNYKGITYLEIYWT